jgi:hypothetical protein
MLERERLPCCIVIWKYQGAAGREVRVDGLSIINRENAVHAKLVE